MSNCFAVGGGRTQDVHRMHSFGRVGRRRGQGEEEGKCGLGDEEMSWWELLLCCHGYEGGKGQGLDHIRRTHTAPSSYVLGDGATALRPSLLSLVAHGSVDLWWRGNVYVRVGVCSYQSHEMTWQA